MCPARRHGVRTERLLSEHIPYAAQLTDTVTRTREGDYVQTFRLGGASFESADDRELNDWHERLNVLWRNVASPHVALWTHLVRRRENVYPEGDFAPGFARQLNQKYRRRLQHETLMVNDLYLSVVYRPLRHSTPGLTIRALRQASHAAESAARASALEASAKLASLLSAALARYEPVPLVIRADAAYGLMSEALEFYSFLINGERSAVALPRGPLNDALGTSRLLFGRELIEYRTASRTRFGAMLGIKEYPASTSPGILNALLSAPFPLILTQSFAFLSKPAAQALLQHQHARLANAGDFAHSQAAALHEALDALTSNHFAMGEHHLSLQVLSDPVPAADGAAPAAALEGLAERLSVARALLAETGMAIAREDLALEAAFWAQLPGHFTMRPRRAPITSRNFAALSSWHNFPRGRPTGNHWGEALTLLKTSAGSPFFFSLHASVPSNAEAPRDIGHTFLCGPTGSGKTVLIGFLIAMLTKQRATQVVFDKDRGLELLVRALGGTYLPLRNGRPTGFNPLQLESTPAHADFLRGWLRTLCSRTRPLSTREGADLDHALTGTLALDAGARRLSRLIEFLDPTDPEGVHAALAPWCATTHGAYAWAFDNAKDAVISLLPRNHIVGFDVTEFLDHAQLRAPVTQYLFHLVRQLIDGRRFVCWMDEFWRMLDDPAFEQFAKDGPKTWRKLNAVMCLSTQSASDVLASPLSRTIIEQTPTKIFFPNPAGSAAEFADGFGLSAREVRLICEQLDPGSRRFLIRQGQHSVVCELDLKGFEAELAVISARATTLAEVGTLMRATGPEPERWLPIFQAAHDRVTPLLQAVHPQGDAHA
jgi:type IV secretion system protein VirB4